MTGFWPNKVLDFLEYGINVLMNTYVCARVYQAYNNIPRVSCLGLMGVFKQKELGECLKLVSILISAGSAKL